MKKFYTYIFGASYMFCMNVFKEKEFPYVWAGGAVTFLSFTNIIVLLELIEYLLLPYELNIYYSLHKYLILTYMALVVLWYYRKKRYLKVLEMYRTISNSRILRILSICYYIVTFATFFLMSFLLRNYDLTH